MTRESADARLSRLLAVVPWIAAHDGPELAEVSRRFGIKERDLLADLNLLFMCGVHPFTPDVLVDVNIADGRVWISMADYFRRPLRLNPQEALALVAAARFVLAADAGGHDALASAVRKLESALGVAPDQGLDVELAAVPLDRMDLLRRAVESRRKVRIGYYSYGRDTHTERTVQPWRVFNDAGQWYLRGWCELTGEPRNFRIDRITTAEATGERFTGGEPEDSLPAGVYRAAPGDALWVLDLDPPAHWIAEQYPNERVESAGGDVLRVTLRAGQRAWMERLLLRAGPHARVVGGDTGLAAGAARRVLGRYQADRGVG